MKHLSAILMLIFISVYPEAVIYAESIEVVSYKILKSNFLPPKAYVGDTVELRLTVETAGGGEIKLPARFVSTDSIKIKDIKVQPHSESLVIVRIYFISYQTGTQVLPEIILGDIDFKNIQVYTNSLLTELKNSKFRGIKEQAVFPGTTLRIIGITLALVLLPFIFLFLYIKIRLWIKVITAERKRKRPYRTVETNLKRLVGNMEKVTVKEFFIELSVIIRKYLQQKMQLPFLSYTTDEIKNALETELKNKSAVLELTDMLYRSDLIKFGGRKINRSEMPKYIDSVQKIIDSIERVTEEEADVEP